MEILNKQLHEYIVQEDAGAYQHKVAEQLDAATQVGLGEYNVFAEQETCRKGDGHGHEQGCNVRGDGEERQVHHLFMQHKIVHYEIKDDIQQGITASASQVAECS